MSASTTLAVLFEGQHDTHINQSKLDVQCETASQTSALEGARTHRLWEMGGGAAAVWGWRGGRRSRCKSLLKATRSAAAAAHRSLLALE